MAEEKEEKKGGGVSWNGTEREGERAHNEVDVREQRPRLAGFGIRAYSSLSRRVFPPSSPACAELMGKT